MIGLGVDGIGERDRNTLLIRESVQVVGVRMLPILNIKITRVKIIVYINKGKSGCYDKIIRKE